MLDDRSYMQEPDWRPEAAREGVSWCLKLIILNIIFYVLQHTVEGFSDSLALYPSRLVQGHVWELLTFQFLHGSLLHILINCAMIWFIGRQIEESLGKVKFLSIYLIGGVFGGVFQCILAWAENNPNIGVVGASAGIFGLMAAFSMMYWNRELTLLIMFILPVRMKAKFILIALAVIGVLGIISNDSGIAHGAHLGGMIWGVLYILFFVQGGTMSGAPPLWNRIRERQSSGKSRRQETVTTDGGARAYSKGDRSVNYPEEDLIKEKIDPILDKISKEGLDSLTDEERDILEKARERMMR